MTQDERWQQQYEQMMAYMKTNHRRPSKHHEEDRAMLNWYKHNKKLDARGELSPDRKEKFSRLQQMADQYRRLNQYDHPDGSGTLNFG